jgi:hypothetical protein
LQISGELRADVATPAVKGKRGAAPRKRHLGAIRGEARLRETTRYAFAPMAIARAAPYLANQPNRHGFSRFAETSWQPSRRSGRKSSRIRTNF